jgi:hypothetical protein
MANVPLDDEQRLCIDAAMSHDRRGNWIGGEVAIKEPRQNGKTNNIVVPLTLTDLFLFEPDLIMHTAHLFKTANETFDVMVSIIDGCFELRRRVKKILRSTHEQSIELLSGAQVYFLARSGGAGRGLGGKRINFDEAFALQGSQIGAMLPTLLARPNTQIVYATSGAKKDSDLLHELNRRGRTHAHSDECFSENEPCKILENSGSEGMVFVEWKGDGSWEKPGCRLGDSCSHHWSVTGCSLDNVKLIKQGNPAIFHGRIQLRKITVTMRKAMPAPEFGREILGWDDAQEIVETVPIEKVFWDLCRDEESTIVGPMVITFDVSAGRKTSSISVCGYNERGAKHAELVKYLKGTDQVVSEVKRIQSENEILSVRIGERKKGALRKSRPGIFYDPSSPAAALIPEFIEAGINPIPMTLRDIGSACGGLQDDVNAGPSAFCHIGQDQLDMAVQNAVKKDSGDGGWIFARKKSADNNIDISPLSTVAMARRGLTIGKSVSHEPRAAWG